MKKALLIALCLCLALPALQAETRFLLDYFLFKPFGELGDEFASDFYYGFKFRQSMFWVTNINFTIGYGTTYTGLGVVWSPSKDTPLRGERVTASVVPISLSLSIAPRDVQVRPYLSIGVAAYMINSSMSGEIEKQLSDDGPVTIVDGGVTVIADFPEMTIESDGDTISELTWPTFKGTAISVPIGVGLWHVTETGLEVGFNASFHAPKIFIGDVSWDNDAEAWVEELRTFNLLLFTICVGKGF